MDENRNHINRKLSEQLPLHSPDQGTWQSLSDKLDVLDAETAYQERLQGLPVHMPDQGTWNLISSRLNRIAYYKTGMRIALSAAAGLLLFFTVSRITDQRQNTPISIPQIASQEKSAKLPSTSVQTKPLSSIDKEPSKSTHNSGNFQPGSSPKTKTAGDQETETVKSESEIASSGSNITTESGVIRKSNTVETTSEIAVIKKETVISPVITGDKITDKTVNNTSLTVQNAIIQNDTSAAKALINVEAEQKSILFQKEQYATTAPALQNSSPVVTKPVTDKNHFALAANYLPENIYNGTNNSLFHNVDLTASYNKEKIRFNTSLGMAYNEEQLEFKVSYDINTPVTAFGQGDKLDTLSYSYANMASEYTGNEKHEYFTYNLGVGKRLFSSGKFSTWINLGAGFGLLLNNPDLITSTTDAMKSQYNALSVRVNSSKPVYNDLNVNFVTAIDFNYKILNRLSITFTPTSRWYLKPVLSLEDQATDKLTLGFRTGMKFDF
jgi:hypothetical protein